MLWDTESLSQCQWQNGIQEEVVIYQVNEGMKFSYKKGDTYRMALRGSRPLGMYMYTAVIQHTHWNVPV